MVVLVAQTYEERTNTPGRHQPLWFDRLHKGPVRVWLLSMPQPCGSTALLSAKHGRTLTAGKRVVVALTMPES